MRAVVQKLEGIDAVLNTLVELDDHYKDLMAEKEEKEEEQIKQTADALGKFEKEARKDILKKYPNGCELELSMVPAPPQNGLEREKTMEKSRVKKAKLMRLMTIWSLTLGLGSMILGAMLEAMFENLPLGALLSVIGGLFEFVFVGCGLLYLSLRGDLKKYSQWANEISLWESEVKKYDKAFEAEFLAQCQDYDRMFLNYVEVCAKKYDEELDKLSEDRSALAGEYIEPLEKIVEQANELNKKLDEVTLIPSDLFHLAGKIASILKAHRADTLKEAINLALEEERRDNEEAARRAEAARQADIMERAAAEEYRAACAHNAAMERAAAEEARAARAHNAAMERAAQEQARAAKQQADNAKKQAEEAERAAMSKCRGCANHNKCSYSVRKHSLSCGSYTPK